MMIINEVYRREKRKKRERKKREEKKFQGERSVGIFKLLQRPEESQLDNRELSATTRTTRTTDYWRKQRAPPTARPPYRTVAQVAQIVHFPLFIARCPVAPLHPSTFAVHRTAMLLQNLCTERRKTLYPHPRRTANQLGCSPLLDMLVEFQPTSSRRSG